MHVLGISAFYHDSAAALIEGGRIVAAVQEERFTRKKHDTSYPARAIESCLKQAGIGLSDISHVVFYDKPFLKFERLLETYLAFAPKGFKSFNKAMPLWIKEKLFQKALLQKHLTKAEPGFDWKERLLFSEHHLSHAASAFYPSPFESAAILTMDGVGEWTTTSLGFGEGRDLRMEKEIVFPHSIGMLYSAFTYWTGFKVNSGEYKLMGLAPYGEPKYVDVIRERLIDIKEDGSFRLDLKYFDYCTGLKMTNERFDSLFRAPRRNPDEPIDQLHMDVAASIQVVVEEVMLRMTRNLARETGVKNLCLAGGVALNSVANGKILREGLFENIWVQPAAGDAGGALGAALAAYHLLLEGGRKVVPAVGTMEGAFLGPSFSNTDIEDRLHSIGGRFERLTDDDLMNRTADALADGGAVGWFQGRMEYGPRALGARSILADPRSPEMQKRLNLKIKYRESFRPFAPAILEEDVREWFDLDTASSYMLFVAPVAEKHCRSNQVVDSQCSGLERLSAVRSDIPAVTHVDYSARVQTVDSRTNPRFHALLEAFKVKTGCPVLVNTSFNVRGEPIVCTPEDAFRCFMGTELDVLVIGNCFLEKAQQDEDLKYNHVLQFEAD